MSTITGRKKHEILIMIDRDIVLKEIYDKYEFNIISKPTGKKRMIFQAWSGMEAYEDMDKNEITELHNPDGTTEVMEKINEDK